MTRKKYPSHPAQEAALLRELVLDFDWTAAARRAGISNYMLEKVKQNKYFMDKAEKEITKAQTGLTDVNSAIQKFHKTQQILIDAMENGDLSVASSVIKSHEMEYRMHGLFEKDNKQKGSAVQINISLHEEPEINKMEDIDAT